MSSKRTNHKNAIFFAGIFIAASCHGVANAQNATLSSNNDTLSTNGPNENDNVLLNADNVSRSEDDFTIVATGHVEARHQGKRLISDKLTYDQSTGIVKAYGNVTIIEKDGTTTYADEITVDDTLASGIVTNFAARLGDGSTVAAKVALRNQNGRNILSKTVYSACPVCAKHPKPTWQIRARTAVQNPKERTLSYNDVVFEVKGVPIIYIPYFRHGDPTAGRHSGLLMGTPGHSGRLGTTYRQPYLWVIDPSSELILAPQYNQYVNSILFADYKRNFFSGKVLLEGSLTKEKFFKKDGEKFGDKTWRGHLFGTGAFKINDTWNWGFGAENASDDLYLFRYGIAGHDDHRGPIFSTGSRLLNQVYIEGKKQDFYSRILGVHFQDLVSAQRRLNTPVVMPAIDIEKSWHFGPMAGNLNAKSSMLYLDRKDDGQKTARGSVALNWTGQKILNNGIIISPNIYARSDYYNYKNQRDNLGVNIGNNSLSRANASASLDMRWPLAKFNDKATFTIEPRVNIATATIDKKQSRITLEDAIGLENDSQSYFMANHSSIYDYWDGGSKITIGANFGIATKKDVSANLFIAKQYRSDTNPYLDRISNFDSKKGDWAIQTNLKIKSNLNIAGDVRLDDKGKLVRTSVSASASYGPAQFNARYQKLASGLGVSHLPNDEITYGGSYQITKNIKLFADDWYDLNAKRHWYTRAGIDLTDDCTTLRLFYQETNTTNRFVEPSKSFKVQIAFKSLGVLDDSPFKPY